MAQPVAIEPEPRIITLSGEPQPMARLIRDAWNDRALAWTLGRQGFLSGYRRASLGLLWAVMLPLVQTTAMALVFSRVARITTPINYVVFVLSGMVVWSFFFTTFATASTAIVDSAGMASKIYFPRLLLPVIRLVSSLFPLGISTVLLVVVSLLLGIPPRPRLLLVLPGGAFVIALALAFSLVTSALHVYFRDVRFIVAGTLTVWFYATPVFYPLRFTSGTLRTIVMVNPVTGVVETMRLAVGAADPDAGLTILITLAWIAALGALAAFLHRRYDRVFSDLL